LRLNERDDGFIGIIMAAIENRPFVQALDKNFPIFTIQLQNNLCYGELDTYFICVFDVKNLLRI
jgi:hypothetical protein